MSLEIERKFLVKRIDFLTPNIERHELIQGYLNSDKNRTVRIRIKDDKGFLTIKGKSNISGTTRYEWEKEIAINEAKELLLLCEKNTIIEKTRYLIPNKSLVFELDVFKGKNKGLIVAEIELPSETFSFEKPSWLGEEVTGNKSYYNSQLSKNPYCYW